MQNRDEKYGLLVIDVQGKLARKVVNAEKVTTAIIKAVQAASLLGLEVILIEQLPHKLGPTVDAVKAVSDGLPVYAKSAFSAMHDADIALALSQTGVTHWVVCGIEAHVCVWQTVEGLLKSGYGVEVLTDAISSLDEVQVEVAKMRMQAGGAVLSSFEMFVFEQMKNAEHPAFRDILSLIKQS